MLAGFKCYIDSVHSNSITSYTLEFYGWSAAYSSSTNYIMYAGKQQKGGSIRATAYFWILVEQGQLIVVYAILLSLNVIPAKKCQHKFQAGCNSSVGGVRVVEERHH